jgi:hypothetical protein
MECGYNCNTLIHLQFNLTVSIVAFSLQRSVEEFGKWPGKMKKQTQTRENGRPSKSGRDESKEELSDKDVDTTTPPECMLKQVSEMKPTSKDDYDGLAKSPE